MDTAQSKFSGASGLFDGTGDYLSVPASTDFVFGTGDFTIDAWIYQTSWPPGYSSIFTNIASWSGTALNFRIMPTGDIRFSTGLGDILASSNTVSLAKWTHIAVVRSSGTLQLFINGVSGGQVANSTNFSESNIVYIGALPLSGGGEMIGGIDELRISKGVARWTSNFTPPPRPYGSNVKMDNDGIIKMEGASSTKLTLGAPQIDGNTVALWHFEETGTTTGTYLYDETANNNDATTTGTTVADGIFGKARKFNGTSDYVSAADSENWNFGSGNFTIDLWVYHTTAISAQEGYVTQAPFQALSLWFRRFSDGTVAFTWGTGVNSWDGNVYSTQTVSSNAWHHIALVRSGATTYIYIDGVSVTTSGNITGNVGGGPGSLIIGNYDTTISQVPMKGNLDEARIIKGRALSADEIAETYRMGANHHLTRQISAVDLSGANKLPFYVAADRTGTFLEAMIGESDHSNYELASSTLALSTTTVLYIKGDEIASSTSIKDSSFSGKNHHCQRQRPNQRNGEDWEQRVF